jgi:hypothetical protein
MEEQGYFYQYLSFNISFYKISGDNIPAGYYPTFSSTIMSPTSALALIVVEALAL